MFVGHYSAAFLAKRIAPELPLPVYFVAAQIIDLLWAAFILLGIEKVRFVEHITATNSLDLYFMPFTHSLPGAIAWSLAIAGLYWFFNPSSPHRMRNTVLLGFVVASHWLLDFFVHRPDLPLWYDSFKVGLSLWNYRIPELLLELVLLWASIFVVLPIVTNNRPRYIVIGIVMTCLQITCVILPTPELDWKIATQLLTCYAVMTLLAYWADKTRAVHPSTAAIV